MSVATVAGLLVVAPAYADSKEAKTRAVPQLKIDHAAAKRDAIAPRSYSAVVKKAAPSVVYVFSTKTVRNPHPEMMPFFNDPMFRRFFGDQMPDEGDNRRGGRQRQRMPEMKQRGLGSGVIISADGYILTNNHVVDGADEVKIGFDGGKKEFVAEVIGRDPKTDLAVLKIDAADLTPATLGDSDALEVGDVVLAIGNPFGIGQTVTSGIVSATGRGGLGIEEYEDFIQTDAAINPGNSGGALVDAEGRLVGINTAIYSRTGGSMGLGFAIPASLARSVMEQLITGGKIVRGYIGVGIQDLSPELKKEFGVDDGGVIVTGVSPDTGAEKAGIKQGDVIVKLDGEPIADGRRLRLMVGKRAPGTEVKLDIVRDGKPQTFKVKLGTQPDSPMGGKDERIEKTDDEGTLNGVGVTDITKETRTQLNLPADLKGALVTEVEPDSAAAKVGLAEGDVILEINRQPVESAKQAVDLTAKPDSKRTLLLVWRDGARLYVMVDETKPEKKD
ncbi:MAG: DegQ family serine endoprotease [Opitutaceae bacterium]|nr:DegQ family serine endoprotease [Opitutaceae bacterium]